MKSNQALIVILGAALVLAACALWAMLLYPPEPDPTPNPGSPTPSHTPTDTATATWTATVQTATPTDTAVSTLPPTQTPPPPTAVPSATPTIAIPTPTAVAPPPGSHVVQRGEHLWGITAQYCGSGRGWRQFIYQPNRQRVKDPNLIFSGWSLVLAWPCREAR